MWNWGKRGVWFFLEGVVDLFLGELNNVGRKFNVMSFGDGSDLSKCVFRGVVSGEFIFCIFVLLFFYLYWFFVDVEDFELEFICDLSFDVRDLVGCLVNFWIRFRNFFGLILYIMGECVWMMWGFVYCWDLVNWEFFGFWIDDLFEDIWNL